MVYSNLAVPFGTVDYTADVLALKAAGANVYECSCVESSDIALATVVQQGGLKAKGVFDTGYAQLTLDQPGAVGSRSGRVLCHLDSPVRVQNPAHGELLERAAKI